MKLERWSLHFYRLRYAHEVVWANAREDAGLFALLEIEADGATGIAEGTLKDTWSGASPGSLKAAFEDFLMPRLRGVELTDEKVVARAFAGIPENRLAKGMIESACWTLRAAAAGEPLWRLWDAGRARELAWTVTRQKPVQMAAEAAEVCTRHGFQVLKVKGGQGADVDLRALAEIRAAVGDDVELYVDANGAYERAEAIEYVRALAAAGVTVAEDPCPLQPDAHFAALQRDSPIPILVDRSCASQEDAALYLERGAQALSTKPGRVGLAETRAIAAMALPRGVRTAVGLYAESALGTLINLQQPGSMAAEQAFYLTMTEQVCTQVPEIQGGRIELPDTADLSQRVDWTRLKRLAL
ncbi:MAG: mandelate racemase/muconate lactonizing enzyme family protein [Burkholderiales bacterium]